MYLLIQKNLVLVFYVIVGRRKVFLIMLAHIKSSCFFISGPEAEGHDTPDSAGRFSIKTSVDETMTPPSFKMRDENFIAFSTPAESPAVHPLQPVPDPNVSLAGGHVKTPGKQRKPRTPKALWIKIPGIGDVVF